MAIVQNIEDFVKIYQTYFNYDSLPKNFKILSQQHFREKLNDSSVGEYFSNLNETISKHISSLDNLPHILYQQKNKKLKHNQDWNNLVDSLPEDCRTEILGAILGVIEIAVLDMDKGETKALLGLFAQPEMETQKSINEIFILHYLLGNRQYNKIDVALTLRFIAEGRLGEAIVAHDSVEALQEIEKQNYFTVDFSLLSRAFRVFSYSAGHEVRKFIEEKQTYTDPFSKDLQLLYIKSLSYDNEESIVEHFDNYKADTQKIKLSFTFSSLSILSSFLLENITNGIVDKNRATEIFEYGAGLALNSAAHKSQKFVKKHEQVNYVANGLSSIFYRNQKNETQSLWPLWSNLLLAQTQQKTELFTMYNFQELVAATQADFEKQKKSMSRSETLLPMEQAQLLFQSSVEKLIISDMLGSPNALQYQTDNTIKKQKI